MLGKMASVSRRGQVENMASPAMVSAALRVLSREEVYWHIIN